jgi:hypothetical protein
MEKKPRTKYVYLQCDRCEGYFRVALGASIPDHFWRTRPTFELVPCKDPSP